MLPFLLICGLLGVAQGGTLTTPTPSPFSKAPRPRLPWSYTGTACSPSCSVSAENAQSFVWVPVNVTFTETITAATRVIIVNKTDDTTTTSMKYNALPDGISLPTDLNAAGTHTRKFVYMSNGEKHVTELAFPTPQVFWPNNYQWSGTLETSGTCRTVSQFSTIPLPSSPQLPPQPMPTHPQAGLDAEGLWYHLEQSDGLIPEFYNAFPSELAFQYCSWNGSGKSPTGVYFGAKFVFDESTSFIGPTDSQKPVPTVAGKTTGPIETEPRPQTPQPVPSAIPVGSQTINFSAKPSAIIAILPSGQTLEPGHTISVDGTPIFLPPSGTAIIVGSATVAFNPAQPTQPPSITIGTNVAPVSFAPVQMGALLPNSGTLLPGSTTYIDGTAFSLAPSGTAIIVDGSSIPLIPTPLSNIMVGSATIPISLAPSASGGLILPHSGTLLPGSSTVVSGTTYSLAPSGTALIVDGSSIALPTFIPYSPVTAPGGIILPGGTTLLPGSSMVVSGMIYSADPTGALVVSIGTSATTVTPEKGTGIATRTATTSEGAGKYTWSGMGGGPGRKTAAAVGMRDLVQIWVGVAGIGAGALIILM